jgi:hypothetical protein
MQNSFNSPSGRSSAAIFLVLLCALRGLAAPAGPTPQVPAGGGAPGPFPNTSVSAVNVVAKGSITGFDGNVEVSGFAGNGPVPWTITKYNRGDFAMRLSPADPATANANTLNRGFTDFSSPADASLAENQSWRPNAQLGVAIPTARQNGPIDWGDGQGGFYPTVAISPASSGPGYNMVDGSFGIGQLDINTGRAGTHAASPEANFSFSVAWFPYDAGWIGGNVGNPDATTGAPKWEAPGQHAAGLVPRLMTWSQFPAGSGIYGGLGLLRLPGVNAVTNGMLFTTSSQGNSDVNLVGVAPTNEAGGASGWIVTIREDSALTGEEVATAGQHQFEFVYVPYNAQNLIGGYVEGTTGNLLQSAGAFTLVHTGVGSYELTIPGKRGTNGTLLLQVADWEAATSVPMASRAFLSYEYDAASGKFLIQSRVMFFEQEADAADASFYFAWVDFENPLAPPTGPRLRSLEQVVVADATTINAKEGNFAVNTDEPEILVTTIDETNRGGYTDPTTDLPAVQALVGYFYDPRTLTRTRGPFLIMGNSRGQITKHDVKYNPFSREYVVAGNARLYDGGNFDLVMISRLQTHSGAGAAEPLISVSVFDGLMNMLSYDDVALAVSPLNGNFILVAEHKVANGEGEGTYGALFGPDGFAITPTPTRIDRLQPTGDEDDPDVVYLPKKNVFLYISNTAGGPLADKIVGTVIQTVDDGTGNLQLSGPEQPLAATTGPTQGHPASIENPFNGEIVTAFDTGGNDVSTGELSYFTVGASSSYTFTQARSQAPYLAGPAVNNPFAHQHPQLAADPNSGVFLIGYQARGSVIGLPNAYVFSVLDTNGAVMPSQLGTPYFLIDAVAGSIDTGANYHNIKYDPFTDSFLAVATAGGSGARTIYLASVTVTSMHLPSPPRLTIAREGGNVIIRWPAAATGYQLQAISNIAGSGWAAAGGASTVEGDMMKVTLPMSGNRFFRLER